ncbi:MAG TPA: hypothetical protein VGM81_26150 [Burkholderiaceae bacterium]|jgi:putative sterol carrier protein
MNMSVTNRPRQPIDPIGLFSVPWAEALCRCWNANADWHPSMALAGEVGFVLELSDELRTLVLRWDEEGRIDTGHAPRPVKRPEFRGSMESWAAVMRGEVSPAGAVLRGQLLYHGPFWFAARYATAFTHVVQAQRLALAAARAWPGDTHV